MRDRRRLGSEPLLDTAVDIPREQRPVTLKTPGRDDFLHEVSGHGEPDENASAHIRQRQRTDQR
jgi:hypothetical protein